MKRRLLNILAAVSLLLFLATAALWPASYVRPSLARYGTVKWNSVRTYRFYNTSGRITAQLYFLWLRGPDASYYHSVRDLAMVYGDGSGAIVWERMPLLLSHGGSGPARSTRRYDRDDDGREQFDSIWQKLGFSWHYGRSTYRWYGQDHRPSDTVSEETDYAEVSIPHWFACLLTLLPPAAWFIAWRRRLRRLRRAGHCLNCDYDLRGHKPGDRCPECGAIFSPAAAAEK